MGGVLGIPRKLSDADDKQTLVCREPPESRLITILPGGQLLATVARRFVENGSYGFGFSRSRLTDLDYVRTNIIDYL
jgi:hypothetical protein